MKLELQKYDILKFGQCLNLNAQTSVLFVYNWKPNMETSIRDYHDSCDLIWKKRFRTYSKLQPKRNVQNSTPRHLACPRCHILEDTPGDTEIQVLIFDHRQISKRRTFGNLRVFETHVFIFDFRWFIKVGEKSWDIRDIHAFDLAEVLIISRPQYNQAIWLIFSNTTPAPPLLAKMARPGSQLGNWRFISWLD